MSGLAEELEQVIRSVLAATMVNDPAHRLTAQCHVQSFCTQLLTAKVTPDIDAITERVIDQLTPPVPPGYKNEMYHVAAEAGVRWYLAASECEPPRHLPATNAKRRFQEAVQQVIQYK